MKSKGLATYKFTLDGGQVVEQDAETIENARALIDANYPGRTIEDIERLGTARFPEIDPTE